MRKWLTGLVLIIMTVCLAAAAAESMENIQLNIDQSTVSDGYITVLRPETDLKLKVTVEKDGQKYQYDLTNQTIVLPLQMGEGEYTVTLEGIEKVEEADDVNNVDSDRIMEYVPFDGMVITADMEDPLSCFLHPNCYVNYDSESAWVKKAEEITKDVTDPVEQFRIITNYMVRNFQYDFIKSVTVSDSGGIMPDIEYCWEKKSGISQDLAALTCAMLRSQGIHAILVCGTLGSGTAHHWVEAVINDEYIRFDPSAELNATNASEAYSTENALY